MMDTTQYRPTKAIIDLSAIEYNTRKIVESYPEYKYYIGVIKANAYGFGALDVIPALLEGGINYLAVSLTEEALAIRKIYKDIPLMLLVPSEPEALEICAKNDICATVAVKEQAIEAAGINGLKVFIRANGGRDLFGGPMNREGFEEIYSILKNGKCALTGIFLHNYLPEDKDVTVAEYAVFEEMVSSIDLSSLDIVSTSNSLSLPRFPKKQYCNACRIGNMIYGIENADLGLKDTFLLTTEVKQVVTLNKGQAIAYGGAYTAGEDDEKIAVLPIGYGDGFYKANAGRDIFINDKRYKLLTVTMDITLAKVDKAVSTGDEAVLIAGNRHLDEIAEATHSVAEEELCMLGDRVRKIYLKKGTVISK